MGEYSLNNKRIARNTIILYVKLVINTFVGIFSTRYVLQALGAEAYGLYAVVGGIVAIMNFLNTTMISTSYRFLAVEYGKVGFGNINAIFNTLRLVHIGLAVFLFIVADVIGVWYINNYLNVSPLLIDDAYFVLHISVVTTAFSVLNVPHQGLVVADERFGFSSIVEVAKSVLKLLFVIFLINYLGNKLRLYAIIMAGLSLFSLCAYSIYCSFRYKKIVKYKINKRWSDYKEIFIYAWWIMFGAVANIGLNQGSAMIINFFFGTILNAAFGVSKQIYSYISLFAHNISQAAIPQITKTHSVGNVVRANNLVYSISKYTYCMMFIIAVPIMLNLEFILKIWLKDVPEYTEQFTFLLIIDGLINCLGAGIFSIISATGKIKAPQIYSSIVLLLNIPLSIICLKIGFPPVSIVYVTIITSILNIFVFIYYAHKYSGFDYHLYWSKTIKPVLLLTIFTLPLFLLNLISKVNWLIFILITLLSILFVLFAIYMIAFDAIEKEVVKNVLKTKFKL